MAAMLWQVCAAIHVLILVSVSVQCVDKESRVVQLAQGPIRGYKNPGDDLFIFYNIPYATAPAGKHKFKAPLPAPVWTDTLEAVDKGIICPQPKLPTMPAINKTEDENCLIANVYVPDTKETDLPVLVIVHGGAFQVGWGELLRPTNLLKNNKVIAVTFNYRIGAYGFLCLGTEYAPGNAGLKDQVTLLWWVKENIKKFGGNPEDVTITGFSAGSASVDLITLSESANGLYNKVIAESGGILNVFSVQLDPIASARATAKQMKFDNVDDDIYALEKFYLTAPMDVLTAYPFFDNADSTLPFAPCVERDVGEEKFLDDSPMNILRSGKYNKVPLLYGFTNLEGLTRAPLFDLWKDKMNEKFSDFLPADLHFDNEEQKEEVALKIKEFYFSDEPVSEENVLAYVNYFSDILFTYATLKTVQLHIEAGNNEIYLYEYSYSPEQVPRWRNLTGAGHVGQSVAVYDGHSPLYNEEELSDNYLKFKSIMRELWLNFITTGAPVTADSDLPAWPRVGSTWSPHMSLDGQLKLRGSLLKERTEFWDQIYQRHYRSPSPPPTPPPRPRTEL